jgi:tetrahydromethanopterin S-methyltransferase subunit G
MQNNWIHKILAHEETPPQGVWESIVIQLNEDDNNTNTTTKILAYEQAPPTFVWDKIAQQLDAVDEKVDVTFSEKILAHEQTPPTFVWDKIAQQLDAVDEKADVTFSEKILAHEVNPPSFIWNKIAAELDTEKESTNLPNKMLAYQVEPPTFIWNKIEDELDNTTKIISIAPQKRVMPFYAKMAAAACIFFVVGSTVWMALKPNEPTTPTAKVNPIQTTPTKEVSETTPPTLLASDTKENVKKEGSTKIDKKAQPTSTPSTELGEIEYAGNIDVQPLVKNPIDNNNEKLKNTSGEVPIDIDLINAPNGYMTIIGPDGQSVRVSSKFSNLIGLLNDKSPISAEWRTKFAAWREQMNRSTLTPSVTNFMDVMGLINLLKEKK